MQSNKEIIRIVNRAFEEGDADKILSYVADDVRWDVMGHSVAIGKEAYRKEIHNENFEGKPVITVKNEIEEGDLLAVEGTVQAKFKGGAGFNAFFFDFYRLENGKIKEMRSYVIERK
jgi:ketosteroid isomerase-like protein